MIAPAAAGPADRAPLEHEPRRPFDDGGEWPQEGSPVQKILVVYAKTGTPLAPLLPRIAARAELHLLTLGPLPTIDRDVWGPACASIIDCSEQEHGGDALIELIVEHAGRLGVHAVFTASEFAVIAVAESARRLGLRGAGPRANRARDKRLMRQ